MNLKDQVKALIDKHLEEHSNLFLTDLTVSAANAICVIIDGDEGVTIDDCIDLSRAIEGNLDSEAIDFSLDVMSFGATEAFVNERQYKKNAGRTVQITTLDGKVQEGLLKGLSDGKVVLETETREPKPVGKGKITVKKEHLFDLNNIKEARVIIKF
nr:ribosome assembly cofactor RimP [uncultured Capnocytophaga sp.]